MATTNAQYITDVVTYTNQERQKAGLPPLTTNSLLNKAAQTHSQNMALKDFFAHEGADGSSPYDRIKATGYKVGHSSENIAAGQETPQEVVNGWMNSSGHRYSILYPDKTEIGVGYYFLENDKGSTQYQTYWTQNFASPSDWIGWDKYWEKFDDFIDSSDKVGNTVTGGLGNDYIEITDPDIGQIKIDKSNQGLLIKAMAGDDEISSDTAANDTLDGGLGNDTISNYLGNDLLKGGSGNDLFYDGVGNDTFYGELGDDTMNSGCVFFNGDNNKYYGGDGNDQLNAGLGKDTLYGDAGNDWIDGSYNADLLYGGLGSDIIFGGNYQDDSAQDHDTLYGQGGRDFLSGQDGNDLLVGGTGNDYLWADDGIDTLIGIEPQDAQPGYGERDTLNGYDKYDQVKDLFVLGDASKVYYNDGDNTKPGKADYALIQYFDPNTDVIQLHGLASDYSLRKSPAGMPSGRAIFLETGTVDELIGIVQQDGSGSTFSLTASYFKFV